MHSVAMEFQFQHDPSASANIDRSEGLEVTLFLSDRVSSYPTTTINKVPLPKIQDVTLKFQS